MNSGYRLIDLELLNWGTFDGSCQTMSLHGHSCLLTGENGTGKSTLIDAFLSLFVPNKRRSYNMSSGSEKRERNETTYVRGAYQREKTRWDTIQVKYLRDEKSLSALAAHFKNPLTKDRISLAQFFWFESNELRKILVISHSDFSLKSSLKEISSPSDLKIHLKSLPYTTIFSSFSEYQAYFTRYVGIRSYKGMDLFNQVSTIKQIGNLNDFIRQNMLEETDMKPILDEFFHTFEDLTLAHQAIVNARLQIEQLDGIDKDARKLSDTVLKLEETSRLQTYVPRYFSLKQHDELTKKHHELTKAYQAQLSQVQTIEHSIETTQSELAHLTHGADGKTREERLHIIEREIKDASLMHERCLVERHKLDALRQALAFKRPLTREQFAQEQIEMEALKHTLQTRQNEYTQPLFTLKQQRIEHEKRLNALAEELLTTQQHQTLIPQAFLELRRKLCTHLNLSLSDMPFAAELMTVKPSENAWRLAIEKLLRPLALKLLVPKEHFMSANQYLRQRHIGMKIVLQCIEKEALGKPSIERSASDNLIHKLEFHPHSPYVAWLKYHLQGQYDYQCVNDMSQFQTATRAITVEGLMKRNTHVSEKDDRNMPHAQCILGWSNEEKIQSLSAEIKTLKTEQQAQLMALKQLEQHESEARQSLTLWAQRQLFDCFDTVDVDVWEKKCQILNHQKNSLLNQAQTQKIKTIKEQLTFLQHDRDEALAKKAVLHNELDKLPSQITKLQHILDLTPKDEQLETRLKQALEKLSKQQTLAENEQEIALAQDLRKTLATCSETKHHLGLALIKKMTVFKAKFPESTTDMDSSLDDLPAFLQRYHTLKKEDLPAHETRFKQLISKNVVTDLTAFKSTLELASEDIKENIEHLNASLNNIPYSERSLVQIRMAKTKDAEIREFQGLLKNAVQMKGTSHNELDLEESFERIKHLIHRLKSDLKWSHRVTDVRNWTDFFVVELERETQAEISYYSDSSGLSGGQKAKLAFTILASALAYQYGIHTDVALEKSFRFVVIDEAFSKSDDRNAKYALELFKQLDLQLLVVTPMDKLDVIKPYIERIFVTQIPRDSHRSQLATLYTEQVSKETA